MPKAKSAPEMKKVSRKDMKKRAKKDPNKPKRPITAFFLYSHDFRDTVKMENPGATVGTIAKVLGERWRNMTDAQKQPYIERVRADKARYDAEMERYQKGGKGAHVPEYDDEEEE